MVVGNFPFDTEGDLIKAKLRDVTSAGSGLGATWDGEGVEDIVARDFAPVGKIVFTKSNYMWKFLKASKGKQFSFRDASLFHPIGKTESERLTAKRTSRALKLIKDHLVSIGKLQAGPGRGHLKRALLGDWDMVIVRVKALTGNFVRVLEIPPRKEIFVVARTATRGRDCLGEAAREGEQAPGHRLAEDPEQGCLYLEMGNGRLKSRWLQMEDQSGWQDLGKKPCIRG